MTLLIGDVHGHHKTYINLLYKYQTNSIQLGDFGVFDKKLPPNALFIRGNHDNPNLCRKSPNYLGDWGYLADEKIFYVSGAWSFDWMQRIPGVSWWPEEELSYNEFNRVIADYTRIKPEIVVSHDCPTICKPLVVNGDISKTKTDQALQACFDIHRPKMWVFAHHHKSLNQEIDGTKFICLDELEPLLI